MLRSQVSSRLRLQSKCPCMAMQQLSTDFQNLCNQGEQHSVMEDKVPDRDSAEARN